MIEALIHVVFIYFFYITTIFILYKITNRLTKGKYKKTIISIALIVSMIPFSLYIPIEVRTYLHKEEFKNVNINTGLSLPIVYFKVFSISNNQAKLFIVEGENKKHDIGNMYILKKEKDKWIVKEYRTIWTNLGGSASEFTIPPYF